jgi:hypothetical protein
MVQSDTAAGRPMACIGVYSPRLSSPSVTGLNQLRGLAIDTDGALVVAEARARNPGQACRSQPEVNYSGRFAYRHAAPYDTHGEAAA